MASLKEGEWSCYRGGQFNGKRTIMLWRWREWRENVREVVSFIEGEQSCYGGQFNGGSMFILHRWSV